MNILQVYLVTQKLNGVFYLYNDKKVPHELAELYESGHFGIKTQQGFYDYHDGKDHEAIKYRDDQLLKLYNALYK